VQQPAILACLDTSGRLNTGQFTASIQTPAPPGGLAIPCFVDGGGLAVAGPSSITIPAGQRSASFPINVNQASTIASTITVYTNYMSGGTQSTLYVYPLLPYLSIGTDAFETSTIPFTLSCSVVAGYSPPYPYAPSGGSTVYLSSNSSALVVPAQLTIPNGSTVKALSLTAGSVSTPQQALITASYNNNYYTIVVEIVPPQVVALSLSSYKVIGGTTVKGTVSLNAPAGPGGLAVNISQTPGGSVNVPTITVPAGAKSVSFNLGTNAVTAATSVVLNAYTWSGSEVGDTEVLQLEPRN
jgi:hypothetical protein